MLSGEGSQVIDFKATISIKGTKRRTVVVG
jgi:hypothetical protein